MENYFIFVQSRPFIHCVLFQVFTRVGIVPRIVTPASWTRVVENNKTEQMFGTRKDLLLMIILAFFVSLFLSVIE